MSIMSIINRAVICHFYQAILRSKSLLKFLSSSLNHSPLLLRLFFFSCILPSFECSVLGQQVFFLFSIVILYFTWYQSHKGSSIVCQNLLVEKSTIPQKWIQVVVVDLVLRY